MFAATKGSGQSYGLFIGSSEATAGVTTLALPAGVALGDVVIAVSFYGGFSQIPDLPTGYTNGQSANDGADAAYRWSYKVQSGTVDTEIAGLSDLANVVHIAFVFRNINNSTVLDVTPPTNGYNSGSGMPNPPSITTSNRSCLVILGMVDSDVIVPTAPSGYTLAAYSTVGTGTVMAAYANLNAGTYNADAFGGSGSDTWYANSIALRLR